MVGSGNQRRSGRPPTIGPEQIVDAAITVIDESRIEACTMRAVADRLGVTPMSIYRHITDKADLLGRIPESLLGPVADDVVRKRRALTALSAVADGLGDVLESHPNLAPLFHQPTPGPAMMRAAAHCVELLIAEGCPPQDAFELLRTLVALVVGQAVTTHGTRNDLGTRMFLIGAASLLATGWTDSARLDGVRAGDFGTGRRRVYRVSTGTMSGEGDMKKKEEGG